MYRRLAAPPQIEHARGRRHAVTYPFLREVNRWVGVPLTGIRRRQDPIADAADWAQESMANQASVVVDGRDQLKAFRKRKRGIGAVGKSWRLDETYIKIRGEDRYWYRAVDKQGNTVDFLLTAKRDRRAAQRFFTRAVKNNRLPKIVNIDKSGANNAGIKDYNRQNRTTVVIRQCKYLNNIVEQDHRAVKRITRPIQGFKDFRCARIILGGVELMHMIRKGQMRDDGRGLSAAQQFYMLAE